MPHRSPSLRARFAALLLATPFACATPPRDAAAEPLAQSLAEPIAQPLAASAAAEPLEPFVIEYYYKAKWGHAAEFIELFRRNYLPQIVEMERQGRVLAWIAHTPRHHASEESRWDFRMQITWRDVVTAHDDHHPEEVIARLFPDRERHKAEEQRRFELLLAHWDVLVEEEPLGRDEER